MERVRIGDQAERVRAALGMEPTVCPPGSLERLRPSFADGWPPASVDIVLERLAAETAERWVFPIEKGGEVLCESMDQRTEIGVAPDGTVVWMVPVLGRTSLVLPSWAAPAGDDPSDTSL